MSGARERLTTWAETSNSLAADAAKAVLSELDAAKAENLEWLRIARGYLDADVVDSEEGREWLSRMEDMRRGRASIHTPEPIVEDLLKKLRSLQEGQARLSAIYTARGQSLAQVRDLLNSAN